MMSARRDKRPLVLVLEDDPIWLECIAAGLEKQGLECIRTQQAKEAVEIVRATAALSALIVDQHLLQLSTVPGGDRGPEKQPLQGLDVVREARRVREDLYIAVMTDQWIRTESDGELLIRLERLHMANRSGASHVFYKQLVETHYDEQMKRLSSLIREHVSARGWVKPEIYVCYGVREDLWDSGKAWMDLRNLFTHLCDKEGVDRGLLFRDDGRGVRARVAQLVGCPAQLRIAVRYPWRFKFQRKPEPETRGYGILELLATKAEVNIQTHNKRHEGVWISEHEYGRMDLVFKSYWEDELLNPGLVESGEEADRIQVPERSYGRNAGVRPTLPGVSAPRLPMAIGRLKRQLGLPREAFRYGRYKSAGSGSQVRYSPVFTVKLCFYRLGAWLQD